MEEVKGMDWMSLASSCTPATWASKEAKEFKEGEIYVSPKVFFDEMRRWGIGENSLIKVRAMKIGKTIYCKFSIPNTVEQVCTSFPENEMETFDWWNLAPAMTPATWDLEEKNAKHTA